MTRLMKRGRSYRDILPLLWIIRSVEPDTVLFVTVTRSTNFLARRLAETQAPAALTGQQEETRQLIITLNVNHLPWRRVSHAHLT